MSTVYANLPTAYALVPGREVVTLSRRVNYNGQVQEYSIDDAKRSVQGNREAEPSDAVYVRQRVSWWLPASEVNEGIPRPGDLLTDANNVLWTIQEVGEPACGVWWKLNCVRLVIEDLTQRLTIKFPTLPATDPYTSALTPQSASNPADVQLVCAIQEVINESVEYQGIDAFMRHFKIWTFSEDYLPKGAILVDDRNAQYEVMRVLDKKRIDSLMLIEAVIQP